MSKHGSNFEDLINSGKIELKDHQIFRLGLYLLDIIEQIHAAGYVFNDLKPDNVLLASNESLDAAKDHGQQLLNDFKIALIDFGYATKYIDANTGEHIEKK